MIQATTILTCAGLQTARTLRGIALGPANDRTWMHAHYTGNFASGQFQLCAQSHGLAAHFVLGCAGQFTGIDLFHT